MQITCTKCGTVTSIENDIEVKSFGCSNCNSLFTLEGAVKEVKKFTYNAVPPVFQIGRKGIIDGVEYEVTGRLIKNYYSSYYWREYILKSKDGNYLYLSESDGHWILLEEIPESFATTRKFKTLTHNSVTYNLYEHTHCKIVAAAGFFDFIVPNTEIKIIEYVHTPNIVSMEQFQGKETTYFGRHFSKSEVKKAFGDQDLPSQTGVGMVQPFLINFYNAAIIFCCIGIFILITQIVVNKSRTETHVLSKTFSFTEFDKKDFVSGSFTLDGGSAPMTISIHSDVNNSWANAQVALVNENTNEEEYANKDVEYYHGNSGGENWSEGSQNEKFNICGVAEGKYHLVITPQKQPYALYNNSLSVNVVWKEPSMWNFFISALVMAIGLVILYFANKNFEQKRWESSDHSPFE